MSTQPMSLPLPPATFDADEFRRRLLGLTDPDSSPASDDNRSAAEHKAAAIDLGLILCEQWGDSLDRMTLWERITSAFATAVAKCGDGDTDRLLAMTLDHVKADASRVATDTRVAAWLTEVGGRPLPWRQGFIRYLATRGMIVCAFVKRDWERVKVERSDARALRVGGELSTGEIVAKGGAQ